MNAAPLDTSNFELVGPSLGAWPGGRQRDPTTGEVWYVKETAGPRQQANAVLASRLLRLMGFRAAEVLPTTDGRVGSRWIEGLPDEVDRSDLRPRADALESFLPAALIAHWDVAGNQNMLPDPASSDGVVLLDFGGTFDTRSLGDPKPYPADDVPALRGFVDPAINRPAAELYASLGREVFARSRARLNRLDVDQLEAVVYDVMPADDAHERIRRLEARRSLLLEVNYDDLY